MKRDYRSEASAWIDEHPTAWELIVGLALERVKAKRRFGMKALIERARWDAPARFFGSGTYKLNNNHSAYLARELVKRYPSARRYLSMRRTEDESAP